MHLAGTSSHASHCQIPWSQTHGAHWFLYLQKSSPDLEWPGWEQAPWIWDMKDWCLFLMSFWWWLFQLNHSEGSHLMKAEIKSGNHKWDLQSIEYNSLEKWNGNFPPSPDTETIHQELFPQELMVGRNKTHRSLMKRGFHWFVLWLVGALKKILKIQPFSFWAKHTDCLEEGFGRFSVAMIWMVVST